MNQIILTFDDISISQYNIAVPLLLKHDLSATFFACGQFVNKPGYVNQDQLLEISENFEIGNHSYRHRDLTKMSRDQAISHIVSMELLMTTYGLPKPSTFCYPGFHQNSSIHKFLEECDYLFARSGCDRVTKFDDYQKGGLGPYRTRSDYPININCTCVFGSNFGYEEFAPVIKKMPVNKDAILCFHDISDEPLEGPRDFTRISVEEFEKIIDFIVDSGKETIEFREMR